MAEEKALGHEGYFQYSGGISWVNPYVKTHQTVHLHKCLKALWHPAGRLSWALWTATSATLLGPTADHLLLRSPDSCRSPSETREEAKTWRRGSASCPGLQVTEQRGNTNSSQGRSGGHHKHTLGTGRPLQS